MFGQEVVPQTKYMFDKVLKNCSEAIEFHFCCKSCTASLGAIQEIMDKKVAMCPSCHSTIDTTTMNGGSFFIIVPIAPQIQALLENPDISVHLNYHFDREQTETNIISEIF